MSKIAFIGAGSVVFMQNLLGDILRYPELAGSTFGLHDIDPVRLATAGRMAERTAQERGARPAIQLESDRRAALEGAQYVVNMVQIGGHVATLKDFEIPRKYGLQQTIGDTHGIGAIFRALRTIPFMLDLARDMEAVCPEAVLMNYTNPMAILCWSLYASSAIRVIGLCHSVPNTVQQMSRYAGIPFQEVTFLAAGINHIAWILEFEREGQDAYPRLKQALANGAPAYDLVRAELCRRLGYYCTESSEHAAEYSAFFIPHAGHVERFNIPLGEYVRRSARNLAEFEQTRRRLDSGEPLNLEQSVEFAPEIIHSIETGRPRTIYGNVRNDGWIENLPEECCVEVPCHVDARGVQPLPVGCLPPQLAAMCRSHISVQELTVRAALEGRRDYVYHAAMLDPLVSATLPLDDIWAMVDEMLDAHRDLLPTALQ